MKILYCAYHLKPIVYIYIETRVNFPRLWRENGPLKNIHRQLFPAQKQLTAVSACNELIQSFVYSISKKIAQKKKWCYYGSPGCSPWCKYMVIVILRQTIFPLKPAAVARLCLGLWTGKFNCIEVFIILCFPEGGN